MKVFIAAVCTLLLVACGSVTPRTPIAAGQWTQFDHKTDYAVSDVGPNEVYLTVKYGSYTFLDKSTEIMPTAKSVFVQIAQQLAQKRGRHAAINNEKYYQSVAYNGITGISTALVSNDVTFSESENENSTEPHTDSDLVKRLKALDQARKDGLISNTEYEQKKKEILQQW
jgi:hypothetical protein